MQILKATPALSPPGTRHPDGNRKDSVPITTRQLEALIRLSQARAKACLRPLVLKEDAEDVVELMKESVKQVHTDKSGNVDKARGGAGGKGKKNRAFLAAMRASEQSEFSMYDLQGIADRVQLPLGGGSVKDFVDKLRDNGEILRSQSNGRWVYKLN
jgi:DNA helicase MCM8